MGRTSTTSLLIKIIENAAALRRRSFCAGSPVGVRCTHLPGMTIRGELDGEDGGRYTDSMKFMTLILVAVLALPSVARADYFLWQDEKTGLTMSFPDTWKMQNNAGDHTIITVMGSSENDQPMCKVDAVPDKRYTIFPARYGADVQKVAVSRAFWEKYLAQYNEQRLGHVVDGAGMGRWFASYALASYSRNFGTVLQSRKAIMFASLYRDTLYVIECSSLEHAYERWESDFRGIIKSVDFKKAYHELPTGEYANFLKDAELYFWSQTGPDGTTIY